MPPKSYECFEGSKTPEALEILLTPKKSKTEQLFYFEYPHPLLVEILWGWALQGDSGAGHSGVGHPRETLGLEHSMETLGLGTPETLWGWALQGDSGVAHSRETLGLGTPRTL